MSPVSMLAPGATVPHAVYPRATAFTLTQGSPSPQLTLTLHPRTLSTPPSPSPLSPSSPSQAPSLSSSLRFSASAAVRGQAGLGSASGAPRSHPQWAHARDTRGRRQGARAQAAGGGSGETVAVVGGTGFIGRALVARLLKDGSTVRVLTRSVATAKPVFQGQPGQSQLSFAGPQEWAEAVQNTTAVVNLAGTPISTRWSPSVKQDIVRSRVDTTNKIVSAILAAPEKARPSVFVSSSAVGFYGVSETATYDEKSPAGSDFLAKVCVEWEAAAKKVEGSGVRLAIIRNGIVLEKDGGALAKMIPIFQLFAGGPLGSGAQWMSWIHRDDMVEMFVEAVRNPKYSGVINGCAPNPVRVSELCDRLGNVLGRPSWLPVPDFALKALLGEGASVVLDGQRVLPKRADELGFQFKYRFVSDALAAILK